MKKKILNILFSFIFTYIQLIHITSLNIKVFMTWVVTSRIIWNFSKEFWCITFIRHNTLLKIFKIEQNKLIPYKLYVLSITLLRKWGWLVQTNLIIRVLIISLLIRLQKIVKKFNRWWREQYFDWLNYLAFIILKYVIVTKIMRWTVFVV